ncbi:MAG: helix-turn-helix domain-containing protein [Thermodesulfobacteriota bacterium]
MELLDEKAVARRLGVSIKTVQGWRFHGVGPRYYKVRRSVRYDALDVQRYLDSCAVAPETEQR